MKILLINGANLNMLGTREPEKYGNRTLQNIENDLVKYGKSLRIELDTYQSNHEGEIVDKIQNARGVYDGIIINAGGYTHTSVVIRDALAAVNIPTVEVHMTNIHAREEFLTYFLNIRSFCCASCWFWRKSYFLALEGLISILNQQSL